MMDLIKQIDYVLKQPSLLLEELAQEIQIPVICDLSEEHRIDQLNYSGIYKIEICTIGTDLSLDHWISALQTQWGSSLILKIRQIFKRNA